MKKANYSVAMWLLYQTCRQLISNCEKKLSEFAAFSAAYTVAFLTGLKTQVDDAEALPSEEARAMEHSKLLEELKPLFKTCQKKFMYLKRYITFAYDKQYWEINWNSCGWDMYDTEMNWSEARNMYAKALQYINEHSADLLANNNMPATFEADFKADVILFNKKVADFGDAKIAAQEGTDAKIDANNELYAKIITSICEVGQVIAESDTVKNEFSFEKMSEMISPVGAAGLKGVVTKAGEPQAGLIVELDGKKTVMTDEGGFYNLGNNLASGKGKIVVKKGDEILTEEDVIIPAGVTVHENIELPVVPPVV